MDCSSNPNCQSWVFNTIDSSCVLKSSFRSGFYSVKGYTSGFAKPKCKFKYRIFFLFFFFANTFIRLLQTTRTSKLVAHSEWWISIWSQFSTTFQPITRRLWFETKWSSWSSASCTWNGKSIYCRICKTSSCTTCRWTSQAPTIRAWTRRRNRFWPSPIW